MMTQKLTISIAIPTYNREQVLIDTLEQVIKQHPLLNEIIVVDQTDKHDLTTDEYLREKSASGIIKYLRLTPPNLPAARNVALREASSDIMLFIDDDVIIGDDFVRNHLKNYLDDMAVTAVAGRVRQRLGWPPIKRSERWQRYLDYRYFSLDSADRAEGIASFVGCNHSVKVVAALSLGGYDTSFVGSGLREETDMAIRLYLAGKKIVYDPTAGLHHLAAPSGGCRPKDPFDITLGACLLYFAVKHVKTLKWAIFREIWRGFRLVVLNKHNLTSPLLMFCKAMLFVGAALKIAINRRI